MLIVWGTKHVRQPEGWVTSFCPICRAVCAHEVQRLLAVDHVYYVSAGNRRAIADELTCRECGVAFAVGVNTIRRSAYRDSPPDPDQTETYAWPVASLDERLRLEQSALNSTSVGRDARLRLIREPIDHLTYQHTRQMVRGPWVSVMSVVLVLALLCSAGSAVCWFNLNSLPRPGPPMPAITYLLTASAVALAVLCAWLYVRLPRLASRGARPLVVGAVARLRPTPAELTDALAMKPRGRHAAVRAFRQSDFL